MPPRTTASTRRHLIYLCTIACYDLLNTCFSYVCTNFCRLLLSFLMCCTMCNSTLCWYLSREGQSWQWDGDASCLITRRQEGGEVMIVFNPETHKQTQMFSYMDGDHCSLRQKGKQVFNLHQSTNKLECIWYISPLGLKPLYLSYSHQLGRSFVMNW